MYQIEYETADFVLIDKHPDISVHNESGQGLIAALRSHCNNDAIVPVHRIDKATSGLLLCAKNPQAASELSQLFQNRQIEKYYLAISANKPKKKQGLIRGDMRRSRDGNWCLSSSLRSPAVTQFFSYSMLLDDERLSEKPKRLFVLKPHTGKTHQLRVALKSVSAPILGDKRYASKIKEPYSHELHSRMYLHAYALRFHYQGENHQFCCQPKAYRESETDLIQSITTFLQESPHLESPWLLNWPTIKVK